MTTKRRRREADPHHPSPAGEALAAAVRDVAGTDMVAVLTTEDLGQSMYLPEFMAEHPGLPDVVLAEFYGTVNGATIDLATGLDAADGYAMYRETVLQVWHVWLEGIAARHGVLLACTDRSGRVDG